MTVMSGRDWVYSEYSNELLASAGLTQDDFVQLYLVAQSDTGRILVVTTEGWTPSRAATNYYPNLYRINRRDDGKTEYYFNRLEVH